MSGAQVDCIADTSVIIGLSRRDPKMVESVGGRRYAITFITMAELWLGALKASNRSAALRRLGEVLPEEEVFHSSSVTPQIYAMVCRDLEWRGVRIPMNDMWIAALAIENHLPLIGRDEHFSRVRNLDFIPC